MGDLLQFVARDREHLLQLLDLMEEVLGHIGQRALKTP